MTDSPRNEPLLRISYVGLGNIGLPVAQSLVDYNPRHQLKVWNRTKEKYDLLDAYGVDHIEELLDERHAWVSDDRRSNENPKWSDGVHVIFISLVNDAVALEIYEKLMAAARKMEEGARVIFVDQSTLHPDTAGEFSNFVSPGGYS
jgi:3-hydroxyisobutyrate dehydrogenase-like beta-hydroxyacid dehydrogenase